MAAAIGSGKFEILANVQRVAIEGPSQGASCVFTFEVLPGKGPVDNGIPPERDSKTTSGGLVIQLGHVKDPIAGFADYLDVSRSEDVFSGPSIYVHKKTRCMLDRSRLLGDCDAQAVAACIQDDVFLERLYATLTAWGLHRMVPQGAKLIEFVDFAESLRRHREAICGLASRPIDELRDDELAPVTGKIWKLIARLNIGNPRSTEPTRWNSFLVQRLSLIRNRRGVHSVSCFPNSEKSPWRARAQSTTGLPNPPSGIQASPRSLTTRSSGTCAPTARPSLPASKPARWTGREFLLLGETHVVFFSILATRQWKRDNDRALARKIPVREDHARPRS